MQSENTADLAAALAKAQGQMKSASFNKAVSFSGRAYKYADLASVIDAIRKPLADNSLAITQATEIRDGGMVLKTTLLHGSGQWVASEYPLPIAAKPQDLGSAMTYAKRYSITSLVCIAADEDDDAESAQQSGQKASTPAAKASPVKPQPVAAPVHPDTGETGPHAIVAATDMEWGGKFVAALKSAKSSMDIQMWIKSNKPKLDELNDSAPKIWDRIEANIQDAYAKFDPVAA